jgi:secondary thiamine-phosphate synthase enzyme
MRQFTHTITTPTRGQGLYDITAAVRAWVTGQGVASGLLTLFVQHTSASLTIQENADAAVLQDLADFFGRLVPEDNRIYRHTYEGPDDMPAHIRAALTQTHLSVPVLDGDIALGVWQAIYVFEHRRAPHERRIALHLIGE